MDTRHLHVSLTSPHHNFQAVQCVFLPLIEGLWHCCCWWWRRPLQPRPNRKSLWHPRKVKVSSKSNYTMKINWNETASNTLHGQKMNLSSRWLHISLLTMFKLQEGGNAMEERCTHSFLVKRMKEWKWAWIERLVHHHCRRDRGMQLAGPEENLAWKLIEQIDAKISMYLASTSQAALDGGLTKEWIMSQVTLGKVKSIDYDMSSPFHNMLYTFYHDQWVRLKTVMPNLPYKLYFRVFIQQGR